MSRIDTVVFIDNIKQTTTVLQQVKICIEQIKELISKSNIDAIAIESINASINAINLSINSINGTLALKANASDVYTITQVNALIQSINDDITNLGIALNGKANANDVYTISQVDTLLEDKASLSGDNVFTGEVDFSLRPSVNGDNIALESQVDDLADRVEDIEEALPNKQDTIINKYKHNITVMMSNATTSGTTTAMPWFTFVIETNSSTQIESKNDLIAVLNNKFGNFMKTLLASGNLNFYYSNMDTYNVPITCVRIDCADSRFIIPFWNLELDALDDAICLYNNIYTVTDSVEQIF